MFSTFVGLGRFINCQRPDYNSTEIKMSTDSRSSRLPVFSLHSRKFDTPKSHKALRALFF